AAQSSRCASDRRATRRSRSTRACPWSAATATRSALRARQAVRELHELLAQWRQAVEVLERAPDRLRAGRLHEPERAQLARVVRDASERSLRPDFAHQFGGAHRSAIPESVEALDSRGVGD